MKTTLILLVATVLPAATAVAGVAPVRVPAVIAAPAGVSAAAAVSAVRVDHAIALGSALPARLPSVDVPQLPHTLPSFPHNPTRAIIPMRFPGVNNPLPLPMPARMASADDTHLDWSFLDGDAAAGMLIPADRGPKPLPPAGAGADLHFVKTVADRPVRVGADPFFDQAKVVVLHTLD